VNHPSGRLGNYYEEAARKSTLDYIGYCHKRLYPTGGVQLHFKEEPIDDEIHCRYSCTSSDGQSFVVRFKVPVEAGGAKIKLLSAQASEALTKMLRECGVV
jgi:hypothetical protein